MLDWENASWIKGAAPLFKGPPTDIFLNLRNLQAMERCAKYELHFMDCMEAYGYHKGREKCRLIYEDMCECIFKVKRRRRIQAMNAERERQFWSGERKNRYEETPPLDLY
ncbi:uncharacterized protein LOC105425858 [Pogonomyrmex barbatus]|uniref:Uncharacterized protein LOC105425858 n=1 Tax=Pogonomyrmex barbatus TaxID=144034 RepID=A0A6I9WT74_9HYME|nr:uncharacterized protein LOC105425858 [Pogonomyrmex barbatus]